jgi:hypothetical protein
MHHTIELDEYVLQVEITDLTDIRPDPTSWASPEDYYGCRELEFSVISGEVYDEDGNATDLGRNGCAAVSEMHTELIEEPLWQIIDGEKEDAAIARAESRRGWEAA